MLQENANKLIRLFNVKMCNFLFYTTVRSSWMFQQNVPIFTQLRKTVLNIKFLPNNCICPHSTYCYLCTEMHCATFKQDLQFTVSETCPPPPNVMNVKFGYYIFTYVIQLWCDYFKWIYLKHQFS